MADKVYRTTLLIEADDSKIREAKQQTADLAREIEHVADAHRKAGEAEAQAARTAARGEQDAAAQAGAAGGAAGGATYNMRRRERPAPPGWRSRSGYVRKAMGGTAYGAVPPGRGRGGGKGGRGRGRGGGKGGRGRGSGLPGAGMLVAGATLLTGTLGAAAVRDMLRVYDLMGQVEGAQQDTRALLGYSGSALYGTGAGLGYRMSETEGMMGALAHSGLSPALLKARRHAAGKDAMRLARGMDVDASTTAGFLAQFRAGGGASPMLDDLSAGAGSDLVRQRLFLGIHGARAAGLENADIPRYLQIIANRTTQLASDGIHVDPGSAEVLATTIREATGARGERALNLGTGIERTMSGVAMGGGSRVAQFIGLRAAGLGKGVSFWEARRRLRDPNRSAELTAALINEVKSLPGSDEYKAFLLETQFGFSQREAMTAIQSATPDVGAISADAAGLTPKGEAGAIGLDKKAGRATSRIGRFQAGEEVQDYRAGRAKNLPGTLHAFSRKTRALRRGAWKLTADAADKVIEAAEWAADKAERYSDAYENEGAVGVAKRVADDITDFLTPSQGANFHRQSGQTVQGVLNAAEREKRRLKQRLKQQGTSSAGAAGGGTASSTTTTVVVGLTDEARQLLRVLSGSSVQTFGP